MENSCDILITNALTIIPLVGKLDTNILIEDGKIKAIRKSIENVQASRVINASKKYVLPGIIDPHVHYGVFTPIDSSAVTESRSAAVGGICTIMRMLRMHGTFKNILKHLEASRKKHLVDYQIHASILNNLQLKEMQFLSKLGINSYKLYMNLGSDMKQILADLLPGKYDLDEIEVNMTDKLVFDIVRNAALLNSLLLVHSEDHEECSKFMKDNNQMRNSRKNGLLELWSTCRPTSSEVVSIQKVTGMAARCGTDLYFVHIGSSDALRAIVNSRGIYKNRSFWAETCPHYLTHTSEYNNLRGKVVPPLRSKDDVSTLWNAIRMGLLDTIGTDHVANTLETKIVQDDLWKSRSGFPGLATMLPVLLSEGVNKNRISLEKLTEICSFNPSRIFRMFPKKGTIQCGSDADLTIVDLEKEQIVTPEIMQSYSDYTIYEGWSLRGWPVMTMVRGKPIMEDGCVDDQAIGHGEFVHHVGSQLSNI